MDGWTAEDSPFHPGERELHTRLGIAEFQEKIGRRVMRPFMPDQHREFFAQLPFIIMGSVDPDGAPWASILTGDPGFVETPTEKSMRINTLPFNGDPMITGLTPDAPVSLLGIEPHTRRRNRANLRVNNKDEDGFDLRLTMSFGNCPQYIQARAPEWSSSSADAPEKEEITSLDGEATQLIRSTDTFFVASHNDKDDPETIGGVDVNHRGGKPGFIKVENNTLTIPDFRGNNAFNTLGNFLVNPRAGLLFIDFEKGDVLQMTGQAKLLWDMSSDISGFEGAERTWQFVFEKGHFLRQAIQSDWQFMSYAKQLEHTGEWQPETARP